MSVTRIFFDLVVTRCWGIHTTTKGLPSLRKRGMPTTWEASCRQHVFP